MYSIQTPLLFNRKYYNHGISLFYEMHINKNGFHNDNEALYTEHSFHYIINIIHNILCMYIIYYICIATQYRVYKARVRAQEIFPFT